MWLDAFLAWLHYSAIFFLVGFLGVELLLIRGPLDARTVRRLAMMDMALAISAMAVLVSGFLRLVYGAKGPHFYLDHWPFYVKLGLFVAVALISIHPTLAVIRWKRMLERDERWQPPETERLRVRRVIMLEVHLAGMIPVFAVVMSRGLGS